MKKWDDAKKYYRMASDLDPERSRALLLRRRDRLDRLLPAAHGRARQARHEAGRESESEEQRSEEGLRRAEGKERAAIQEGIDSLNKAIQLRPDYDDAMAYLNLMYREKARR